MHVPGSPKRDHRTPVALRARLRSEIGWGNTQICNVSRGGMMLRHIPPPPIGSYVEVCRGSFSVVGRVRWISTDRFDVQALEEIQLDELSRSRRNASEGKGERRRRHRPTSPQQATVLDLTARLERSRQLARRLEFIVALAAFAAVASLALQRVGSTLSAPLSLASQALAPQQDGRPGSRL